MAATIIVGIATIASVIVAWLQLSSQLDQIDDQTRPAPAFNARVDDAADAQALVTFDSSNDYQVRRIDLECLLGEGDGSCVLAQGVGSEEETVLFISTRPGCQLGLDQGEPTGWECVTHWVHLSSKDPFNAQLDNGQYGAGNIVVHGYFAISLRQALGSAPPEVQHIFLRAVAPELAPQR